MPAASLLRMTAEGMAAAPLLRVTTGRRRYYSGAMGGIVAVIGQRGDPEPAERLGRMLARSPDRGAATGWAGDGAALAVQSLGWDASLVEVGDLVGAFHGWVGNWDELAGSLGERWDAGAPDAARVAFAFERIGARLFTLLRGEFAFVIVDRAKRALVAARDVVGTRPLFYRRDGGRTYVASEIRQVLAGSGASAVLDEQFLADSLAGRFAAREETLVAGVRRLIPGHGYGFAPDAEAPRAKAYWQPPEEDCSRTDEAALAEELRATLERAVRRAIAPRRSAVALSGGMDSTTVWTLARATGAEQVSAVSMVFPGMECDESDLIRSVVATTGGEWSSVDAAAVHPYEAIGTLAGEIDELFAPSLYHLRVIADAAKARGADVLYFGLGGDEWLSGSPAYLGDELRRGHVLRVLRDGARLPLGMPRARLRALVRHTLLLEGGLARRRERTLPPWLHPSRRSALLRPAAEQAGSRARRALAATLAMHRGANYFGALEQLAARCGVEVRCPLDDLDVIEFAFRTPGRMLVGGRGSKHLLRRAMAGALPAEVVARRGRSEFSEPFRRDVAGVARGADAARWQLTKRAVVVADEVERIRTAISERGEMAREGEFTRLLIAESVCARFSG